MEKDTVLLAVEKYNELRDFKQKIEEGKTNVISSGWNHYTSNYITTEKAVEQIAESNKLLQKELEQITESNELLQKENDDLRKANKPKEISINDIKKMSYWEFRKWRNS